MIKKLVIKLDSLERSLRELRKLKGLTGKVERQPVMNLQKLKSDSSAFTMDYDQHSKMGTVRAVSNLEMDILPVVISPKLAMTTKNVPVSQSPEVTKNMPLLQSNSKSTLRQVSEAKPVQITQNYNSNSNQNLNTNSNNLNAVSNEVKIDSTVNKNFKIETK